MKASEIVERASYANGGEVRRVRWIAMGDPTDSRPYLAYTKPFDGHSIEWLSSVSRFAAWAKRRLDYQANAA